MTTHPITLTTSQLRAALAGRLEQVRMPVEPQPPEDRVIVTGGDSISWCLLDQTKQLPRSADDWRNVRCPFGVVGDRLWVRESFMVQPTPGCSMGEAMRGSKLSVYYRDEIRRDVNNDATVRFVGGHIHAMRFDYNADMYGRWRGLNLMKEWASRLAFDITGIRVERDEASVWCWVLDVRKAGE
jgi:hypothetical protein